MSSQKLKGSLQVEEFLVNLEHEYKKEIIEVRKIILETNPLLSEHIKWKAPSFIYENEDRITFNLFGKGFFRLVFHSGAKGKKLEKPLFVDTTGLLEWASNERAIMKLTDMNDIRAKENDLKKVITKWLEAKIK